MICPKCKTKIGIMKHEIVLEAGVIHCNRCVMCGYWSQPYPTYKWQQEGRQGQINTIM
jgi:Zn ribbon nucleic-acid-binding protein